MVDTETLDALAKVVSAFDELSEISFVHVAGWLQSNGRERPSRPLEANSIWDALETLDVLLLAANERQTAEWIHESTEGLYDAFLAWESASHVYYVRCFPDGADWQQRFSLEHLIGDEQTTKLTALLVEVDTVRRQLSLHLERFARKRERQARHLPAVPATSADTLPIDERPHWDADRLELKFKGLVIRHVRGIAKNILTVLDCFQEEGWPARIDNPLSDGRSLNDALHRLNQNLSSIRFSSDSRDESDRGVIWSANDV